MTIRDAPDILTVQDFDAFVNLPENADSLFEYVRGELVDVPSNPFVSKIASLISGFIFMYLMKNDIGHLTGEAGGYMVAGERYAPDVAFISYEKQPDLAKSGYNPTPPDLAVEVVSSESTAELERLTFKLGSYLSVGTMVWIVSPERQVIEVHRVGVAPQIYTPSQTIELADVLPGFTFDLSAIFKVVPDAESSTEEDT